jgi:hypothetical protein
LPGQNTYMMFNLLESKIKVKIDDPLKLQLWLWWQRAILVHKGVFGCFRICTTLDRPARHSNVMIDLRSQLSKSRVRLKPLPRPVIAITHVTWTGFELFHWLGVSVCLFTKFTQLLDHIILTRSLNSLDTSNLGFRFFMRAHTSFSYDGRVQ